MVGSFEKRMQRTESRKYNELLGEGLSLLQRAVLGSHKQIGLEKNLA